MNNPTPEQIKKARLDARLTQTQAAALIYKNIRTWQQWEAGDREMDPAFFELFKIKIARNNARI
jgi:putative transcriptional regulator